MFRKQSLISLCIFLLLPIGLSYALEKFANEELENPAAVHELSVIVELDQKDDDAQMEPSPDRISPIKEGREEFLDVDSPKINELPDFIKVQHLNTTSKNAIFPTRQGEIRDSDIFINLDSIDFLTGKTFKESISSGQEIFLIASIKYDLGSAYGFDFCDAYALRDHCKANDIALSRLKKQSRILTPHRIKEINYYMFNPINKNSLVFIARHRDLKDETSTINNLMNAYNDKKIYLALGMFFEFNEDNRDMELAEYFYKAAPDSLIKYYMLYWCYRIKNQQLAQIIYYKVMRPKYFDIIYHFALALYSRSDIFCNLTAKRTDLRFLNIISQLQTAGYEQVKDFNLEQLKKALM